MDNFQSLGLSETLMRSLERMKFDKPTPIQSQAIPPALLGKDILGSAQTGTGKTAAFGIPLIEKLLKNPQSAAIVMTPTRELAVQVMEMMDKLAHTGKGNNIKSTLLIGGAAMQRQIQQLRRNPRLIVGTPGRINDHLDRRNLRLDKTDYLVLDETDRMLDIGFTEQIERVLEHMPEHRQTLLFSATLPKNIIAMSKKYLQNPVRVSVDAVSTAAPKIKQEELRVGEGEKYKELLTELQKREGSIIIFVKTKRSADKMAIRLRAENHNVEAIHGDLRQNKRDKVIRGFRNKSHRILVATDVAARGLDIPHIEHVINYDLPQVAEDFIHRIGRTARAGAEGHALSFITPADGKKWTAIRRVLNPNEKSSSEQRSKSRNGKNVRPFRAKKSGDKYNGGGSSEGRNRRSNRKGKNNSNNDATDNTATGESRSKKYAGSSKPKFNGKKPTGGKTNGNKSASSKYEGSKPSGNKDGGGKKPFNKNRNSQSKPTKSGGQKRFNKG